MKTSFLHIFCLLICWSSYTFAQPYVEGGNTRHRFAQLLVGADLFVVPQGGTGFQLLGDERSSYEFPTQVVPRLSLAGTHFWGYSEFFVTFPITNILDNDLPDEASFLYSPGVSTGMKVYPWRVELQKLRPYVGAGFNMLDFRLESQTVEGRLLSRASTPVMAGLTYQKDNLLFELGATYLFQNDLTYYLNRNQTADFEMNPLCIHAGLKWQLETTLSAEKSWQDGSSKKLRQQLAAENELNSFSLAIGPSAGFVVSDGSQSTYNQGERAFLGKQQVTNTFPDVGVGYYYYPWDAHLNLAFRMNRSTIEAYGYEQTVKRRSLALEGFKFLFDYHGFVPFIGPLVSYENIILEELDGGQMLTDLSANQIRPGFVFGWDIRPNNLQHFILRTNLRYTPIRLELEGDTQLALDQLEFNFIQLVFYPQRKKNLR